MKYTPGPWTYHSTKHDGFNGPSVQSQYRLIVSMPTPEDKEGRANARLIAAAPIMLASLKKVNAFIDDLSKSNPGYLGKLVLQDYGQFNEAMIIMPSAIALAEGRIV